LEKLPQLKQDKSIKNKKLEAHTAPARRPNTLTITTLEMEDNHGLQQEHTEHEVERIS